MNKLSVLIDATALTNKMTGVTRYGIELLERFAQQTEINFSFIISSQLKKKHRIFEIFDPTKTKYYVLDVKGIGPIRELKFLKFKLMNKLEYDVFHCLTTNAPFAFYGKSICTVHDLKYVLYPHYLGDFFYIKSFFLKMQIAWSIAFYKQLICVSGTTQKDLFNSYGFFKKHILKKSKVIYHGRNTIPAANLLNGLPAKYIFYIGEIRPHKNLGKLIEAFNKVRLFHQNLNLVVVGKKHDSLDIDLMGEGIFYLGPIEDQYLYDLYKKSQALIFISLYEGFGFPLVEAMELGVPIVAGSSSCLPEVAGDAALYVDPFNVESIAEGIEKIVSDKNLRDELVKKGYRQVLKYDWDETARQTLQIYRDVGNANSG